MSLDSAARLVEILLAIAFAQQSLEHVFGKPRRPDETLLFGSRLLLCIALLLDWARPWPLIGLAALSLILLGRFQGPYNGGSDRMGLLALWCLTATQLSSSLLWREAFFGYLGLQLVLSYFISGWVKVVNPDWRSGRALRDVFLFSAYPVGENLRKLAGHPRLLFVAGWTVMLLELAFPLMLLGRSLLIGALVAAGAFHLANACLFGLNRFFWTWLSVYPAVLWLQSRLF